MSHHNDAFEESRKVAEEAGTTNTVPFAPSFLKGKSGSLTFALPPGLPHTKEDIDVFCTRKVAENIEALWNKISRLLNTLSSLATAAEEKGLTDLTKAAMKAREEMVHFDVPENVTCRELALAWVEHGDEVMRPVLEIFQEASRAGHTLPFVTANAIGESGKITARTAPDDKAVLHRSGQEFFITAIRDVFPKEDKVVSDFVLTIDGECHSDEEWGYGCITEGKDVNGIPYPKETRIFFRTTSSHEVVRPAIMEKVSKAVDDLLQDSFPEMGGGIVNPGDIIYGAFDDDDEMCHDIKLQFRFEYSEEIGFSHFAKVYIGPKVRIDSSEGWNPDGDKAWLYGEVRSAYEDSVSELEDDVHDSGEGFPVIIYVVDVPILCGFIAVGTAGSVNTVLSGCTIRQAILENIMEGSPNADGMVCSLLRAATKIHLNSDTDTDKARTYLISELEGDLSDNDEED